MTTRLADMESEIMTGVTHEVRQSEPTSTEDRCRGWPGDQPAQPQPSSTEVSPQSETDNADLGRIEVLAPDDDVCGEWWENFGTAQAVMKRKYDVRMAKKKDGHWKFIFSGRACRLEHAAEEAFKILRNPDGYADVAEEHRECASVTKW